jgi:DUF1680 family protein
MTKIEPKGKYADAAELAMYNGSISGVSMSGDEFFYENPLAIDLTDHNKNPATKDKERYPITQRVKVFGCSCCPPNILRFINSIADFMYTEDGKTLYVHHYMNSETEYDGKTIRQTTNYPACGKVKIETEGYEKIAVRVPGWCTDFEASAPYELRDGYAYFNATDVLDVDFHIKPRLVASARSVHDNAGRVALIYGPVVYCMEGVDNNADIFALSIDTKTAFELAHDDYFGMPRITANGYLKIDNGKLYTEVNAVQYEDRKLHFIPYYAMENRGETDMQVWVPMKY